MHPLDDRQRTGLLRISLCSCIVALLLTPLAARSSIEMPVDKPAFDIVHQNAPITRKPALERLAIGRDPFVAPPAAVSPTLSQTSGVVGTIVHQGEPMDFSVPGGSALIVRALVSGTHSSALVEDGGRTRIVQTGDRLTGSRIVKIDATGLLLEDGRQLPLVEERQ